MSLEKYATFTLSSFEEPKKIAKLLGFSDDNDPDYIEVECNVTYSVDATDANRLLIEDVVIKPTHANFSVNRHIPLGPDALSGAQWAGLQEDLYADAQDQAERLKEDDAMAREVRAGRDVSNM